MFNRQQINGYQNKPYKFINILILLLFIVSACKSSISYKPPLLPIKISIDNKGNINVSGDMSVITPIGTFSIGANYTIHNIPNTTIVILRDKNKSKDGIDEIFRIKNEGDTLTAILDGKTIVKISNNQILIDITDAKISSIEFIREENKTLVKETSADGIFRNPQHIPYKTFEISEWALYSSNFWQGLNPLIYILEYLTGPLVYILHEAAKFGWLLATIGWIILATLTYKIEFFLTRIYGVLTLITGMLLAISRNNIQ